MPSASSAPRSTTSARGRRWRAKGCGCFCSAGSSAVSPAWERVDCWREDATRLRLSAGLVSGASADERARPRGVGVSAFPRTRLRRLRRSDRLRALVRETRLDLDDFVLPLFVGPATEPNPELPAMGRFSVDHLVAEAADAARLGVRAAMLFGIPDEKDADGSGAWDEDGVIQRALRALRESSPGLVLLTDVCLCEYTSHGHCGVLEGDEVDNDSTVELLARTAVSH